MNQGWKLIFLSAPHQNKKIHELGNHFVSTHTSNKGTFGPLGLIYLPPGSLTHWKKWYPSLFSSLKLTPFFEAKHWLFSSKQPLFHYKTLTFQSKMNPLFWGKTLTFQPKWTPHFTGKTLNIKINPFFSKFKEVSTKIPPFSRKMRILYFLIKYPFIHEF